MTKTEKKQPLKILTGDFHQMPNAAEWLDPYEYRVLGHIIRRCGPHYGGQFWESMRQACAACHMSLDKYQKTIKSLVKKNVIRIEKHKGKRSIIRWNHPKEWDIELYTYECAADLPDRSTPEDESVLPHSTPDSDCTATQHSSVLPHSTVCTATQYTPSNIDQKDPNKEDPSVSKSLAEARQHTHIERFDPLSLTTERLMQADSQEMASLWHRRLLMEQPNAVFQAHTQEKAINKLHVLGYSNIDIFKVFLYQKEKEQRFPRKWLPTDLIKDTKDGTCRFQYVLSDCESNAGFINRFNYALKLETKNGTHNRQVDVPF